MQHPIKAISSMSCWVNHKLSTGARTTLYNLYIKKQFLAKLHFISVTQLVSNYFGHVLLRCGFLLRLFPNCSSLVY